MPAQIVVVKRSRRRAFAMVRMLPAWLRAFVGAVRGRGLPAVDAVTQDLGQFEAFRDSGLLAPEWQSGTQQPAPSAEAFGEPGRCSACQRCVRVCPSAALDHRFDGEGTLTAFDLDPGRCIGCGECAGVCPENWLVMQPPDSRIELAAHLHPRSLFSPHLSGQAEPAVAMKTAAEDA